MANVTFKARTDWSGQGVYVESRARRFQVAMDEPEPLGTNRAMNPVELLLSSLGGCIAILVSAFAEEDGLQIEDVSVEVEGDLDPDGFRGKAGVRPGFQDIRVQVNVVSPEPERRVNELVELALERCPVKDTLSGVSVKESYTVHQP
ncbi:MAG: OsmC family protein [Anaerolineae bacterium]